MNTNTPYHPIPCGLHDELLLRATRRRPVRIRFLGPRGDVRFLLGVPVDVRTRGSAEYLVLADGTEIRLDHLLEVDGISFGGAFSPQVPLNRLEHPSHSHSGPPCRPRPHHPTPTPIRHPDPSSDASTS